MNDRDAINRNTEALNRLTDVLSLSASIRCIEQKLDSILSLENLIMAKSAEILALIDKLDENSNQTADEVARITVLLTDLKDQTANGVSAQDAAAIQARLEAGIQQSQAVEDKLRALGSDPDNPVP